MKEANSFEIREIHDNSPAGKYYFRTKSGSDYILIIDSDKKWIQRFNEKVELRRDTEKIFLKRIICLKIGKPARLVLEPLGFGDGTLRITSSVTEIYQ